MGSDITMLKLKKDVYIYQSHLISIPVRVFGWRMEKHIRTELPINALRVAIDNRDFEKGLIHH